ncbi:MAG: aminotransferase class V-fold PLP-dependent enzyme [Candidatus Sumerlaeota bacterium]|nr:aminotransferase class V-fold PLP-dependent enzyme [Candidatus Sumerlaeota bacterium]
MSDLSLNLDREFPIRREWVYMNHAGVCPLPARVAEAIRLFADQAAAAGATRYADWKATLQRARERAAGLLGCEANEVAFVKNTTHGLLCVANSIDWRAGDNVVTFEGEFPANFWPWKNLERLGVERRAAPWRPDGRASLQDLEALMDSRTRLAAASWVSYANGFRLDGAAFGALCRRRGVLSCFDGIQGLGAAPANVAEWGIDFLSADGHKWLLAPEGFGVLYCSNRAVGQLNDAMTGWCSRAGYGDYEDHSLPLHGDARRFEEGSHNMLGAHAFDAAMGLFHEVGMDAIAARIRAVTNYLVERLRRAGWAIHSPRGEGEWSGIVSVSKADVDPQAVVKRLFERRVVAAARVGRVRFSPHFYNTEDEADRAMEAM